MAESYWYVCEECEEEVNSDECENPESGLCEPCRQRMIIRRLPMLINEVCPKPSLRRCKMKHTNCGGEIFAIVESLDCHSVEFYDGEMQVGEHLENKYTEDKFVCNKCLKEIESDSKEVHV